MADLADDFLFASGRLQTLCYKADIEGLSVRPVLPASNYSTCMIFRDKEQPFVGVLDPFWEEKGYVTPEEYSTFCNKTVPLVRFPENGLAEQRDIERSPKWHISEKNRYKQPISPWEISNQAGEKIAQATS